MTQFGTWQPKIRGKLFYNWPQGACEEALRFTSAGQLGGEPYDVVIVGAGVVGCGLAYRLSQYDLRVLLVDRLHDVGEGTSKANSALIHSGYDAKPGSLESKLLHEAEADWPGLAARLKIPLDPIGGIMMAVTDEQERQLEAAEKNAHANRATDVRILSAAEIREREPNASPDVRGGLLVPGESLVDPFMASIAYAEIALANGVDILLGADIAGVELGQPPGAPLHHLVTADGHRLPARRIVNAAGLGSRRLADGYGGGAFDINPRRGQFLLFDKSARPLVQHILLPVPTAHTKGVLVAPTIFGNLLAGPTAEDLPLDDPAATHTTVEGIRRVCGGRLAARRWLGPAAGHCHLRRCAMRLQPRELRDPPQRRRARHRHDYRRALHRADRVHFAGAPLDRRHAKRAWPRVVAGQRRARLPAGQRLAWLVAAAV